MSMLKRLKRLLKHNYIIRKIYIIRSLCLDSGLSLADYVRARNKNYVFMVATHNNAGDIAQSICIKKWLERTYKGYTTINVGVVAPDDEKALRDICKMVKENDNVFIHSGFNITDIGQEFGAKTVFPSHKIILEELKNHRIVFFPQSVQYKDINKWDKIKKMYMKHNNIVFISRDKISQKYARELLPNARHLCYPDIVTTWIGGFSFEKPENKILLCVREDTESVMDNKSRKKIIDKLRAFMPVDTSDTELNYSQKYVRGNREKVVMEMIKKFSQHRVVVTDRYHGVIFSLVAGRPVVVLKTSGHKVVAGLDWFPQEIKKYVAFVEDITNVEEICQKASDLAERDMSNQLPKFFLENYYDKLYDEIR